MPETASEATQTAEQPIPMRYDGDKGMYLPDNGGNVINFQPVMTQTNGGEAAPGTVRQIPVAEVPAGPAPGETPTTSSEQNGETAKLKQQIEELRAQLAQEQEERKRQQDEQTKAIKGLASALKAQNKLLKQLLEQKDKPKDPTEPDPTDPDEEERKRKEEEERKRAEEEEEARKKAEEEEQKRKEEQAKNKAILEKGVSEARKKLLEVVIRRKGRMGDKFTLSHDKGIHFNNNRGQEDKKLYDEAMKEWLWAIELSAGYLRETLEEQMQKETGEIDPEAIREAITKFVYEEQTKLADQEVTLNNQLLDESIKNSNVLTRPVRKFMRKWAGVSTKKKLMIGLGLGVVVGVATGTAGLGVAVLAAGSAAKFSLGLMNRKASLMNDSKNHLRRYKGGLDKEFQETMANILGDDPTQLESRLVALIESTEGNVDEQIKKAHRRNRLGNAMIVASGVLMGLGSSGVELIPGTLDGVHHLEHAVENGVHHVEHVFGGGGHATEVPGAGGQSATHEGMGGLFSHGSGHEAVVRLPSNMHLGNLDGHDAIFDNNGHVIFNDPNGIWNHQGRLSSAAIKHLRDIGLKVTENKNYYDPGSGSWHFYDEVS